MRNTIKKEDYFSKVDSQVLKGLAILIMIHHHNFLPGRYDEFSVLFSPFSETNINNLAQFFKICVSIFAFITGYGLFCKYYADKPKNDIAWCLKRYIKTFSTFWFNYIMICVATQIIDKRFARTFSQHNIYWNTIDVMLDFLGLSHLLERPTMISTWWYMGADIIFICSIPLIKKLNDNISYAFLLMLLIPRVVFSVAGMTENMYGGGVKPWPFFVVMMMGCIFARYKLFDRIQNGLNCSNRGKIFNCILLLMLEILLYKTYGKIPGGDMYEIKIVFTSIVSIIFIVLYIVPITFIRKPLMILGRHSTNIFLVHSFFRAIYLRQFIYSFRHFILIDLVLLVISILYSVIIEMLKKILGYDRAIKRLLDAIPDKD